MKEIDCVGQTRRSFCAQAATFALFGGTVGVVLSGCGGPTSPSDVSSLPSINATRANGLTTLTIDASSPLSAVGSAARVVTSGGDFLVARTAQETFVALAAICTHENCAITGFSNQTYVCPCHGSTFDISGRVLGGPAPRGLGQYLAQFSGGVLTITG